MLDVVFALDCILNGLECLEVDKPFQSVPFCKTLNETGAMLEHASHEIVCDADIENAVRFVG